MYGKLHRVGDGFVYVTDKVLSEKELVKFKREWQMQYVGKKYDPIKPLGWWDKLVLWWRK